MAIIMLVADQMMYDPIQYEARQDLSINSIASKTVQNTTKPATTSLPIKVELMTLHGR